jgi:hypothetical protein
MILRSLNHIYRACALPLRDPGDCPGVGSKKIFGYAYDFASHGVITPMIGISSARITQRTYVQNVRLPVRLPVWLCISQ